MVTKRKGKQKAMTEMEFKVDTNKPTPRYNKVKGKVNKLLSAGLTYIEEACTELRKDWVPTMTDEVMKKNPGVQEAIRERIYDDFSKERNDKGVWKESSIDNYFPNWLRFEDKKQSLSKNLQLANEAKLAKKFLQSVQTQKPTIDRIVDNLEEPPKEEEQKEETVIGGYSMGPSKYQKLGGETKSPLTKMGDIRDACRELWKSLTEKEHMPHPNEDLIVDHIKPTREYRKFVYELDEDERTGLHNWLTFTEAAINDMLEIIDGAEK